MAKLRDVWFCPIVQFLLDCSHHCLPRNALQREEGSLAVDEAEGRPVRQVGERQQQRWIQHHISREECRCPEYCDTKCQSFTVRLDSVPQIIGGAAVRD